DSSPPPTAQTATPGARTPPDPPLALAPTTPQIEGSRSCLSATPACSQKIRSDLPIHDPFAPQSDSPPLRPSHSPTPSATPPTSPLPPPPPPQPHSPTPHTPPAPPAQAPHALLSPPQTLPAHLDSSLPSTIAGPAATPSPPIPLASPSSTSAAPRSHSPPPLP